MTEKNKQARTPDIRITLKSIINAQARSLEDLCSQASKVFTNFVQRFEF